MVAIIDYGVGNLFSLRSALARVGAECVVTRDPLRLAAADRLILPGVGAFGDAASKFRACGLEAPLAREVAKGKPLLGICVGMQLLFDRSYEFGVHEGLGYIKGEVAPLSLDIDKALPIPHVGWNSLRLERRSERPPAKSCARPGAKNSLPADAGGSLPDDAGGSLLAGAADGTRMYFVHSFYAKCDARFVVAWTDYGVCIPAMVRTANVQGSQFHPEKSGVAGIRALAAFCNN